jgi:excisionase family DNA binding protein
MCLYLFFVQISTKGVKNMSFSPQEVADKLGVCRVTVLRMIRKGDLPAMKMGKTTIRIAEEDFEAFKARCSTAKLSPIKQDRNGSK